MLAGLRPLSLFIKTYTLWISSSKATNSDLPSVRYFVPNGEILVGRKFVRCAEASCKLLWL